MTRILMQSDKLYGRELQISDLAAFTDMQSNPNVMQFVGKAAMSPAECKQDLENVMNHYKAKDGFRVWGFFQHEDDQMVGTGAIISFEKGNEIGFRLREKYWGKGYGVEITKNLLQYGFLEIGLDKIFAEVDQKNIHSVRVLDKTLRNKKAFWNTEFQSDDYYYELSKEEYEKIRT